MTTIKEEQYLEPWEYFLRLNAEIVSRIEKRLSSAGQIPLTWYDVLLVVNDAPSGSLRMSEIADKIVLSRSALTRSVDKLVDEGFLRREKCPEDRRGAIAIITEKGKQALDQAWPVYREGVKDLFARGLEESDLRSLLRVFEKVYAKFEADPDLQ